MKIRLGILHNDTAYLNRLTAALEAKYSGKLVLYSFSNLDVAKETLKKEKIDVFLAEDAFEIDQMQLPDQCGFAYFVDSPEVETLKGSPAICRFQRAELLYKQILGLFSETLGEASVRNIYSDRTKVLVFSSPCGGTGTSTVAAACAVHYAALGKRCLYLDLEDFGGANTYFCGEGTASMSDVVYAVKSNRGNLQLKLESYVKRDSRGVGFFSNSTIALDMMELTSEERAKLISTLSSSGNYDILIVNMAFDLRKETRLLLEQAHVLVWVSDGLPKSDHKITRAYSALEILCQGTQGTLAERVCLLRNKFVEDEELPKTAIHCAGNLPKIRHQAGEPIIDALASFDAFDNILGV